MVPTAPQEPFGRTSQHPRGLPPHPTPQFFVFRSGTITFAAGVAALLMYALYVGMMAKNDKVFELFDRRGGGRTLSNTTVPARASGRSGL